MLHVIVNANSVVKHAVQIKNGIMISLNASVKSIIHAKGYSWNPSTWICENSSI